MKLLGRFCAGVSLALLGTLIANAQPPKAPAPSAGVLQYLEAGQPPVVIHPTVEWARQHAGHGHGHGPGSGSSTTNNLLYGGGVGGIGVETAPRVYLVLWGSQWNGGDPSGEAAIVQDFLSRVGGSSWLNSVTQYCQGVTNGTEFCNGSGTAAGNPGGILQGVWYDSGSAAPGRPRQSDLAAEAVRAAAYFGNTASGSNNNTQYVIATASGDDPQGFGHQYCAWHSYTSSSYGNVAYTNLPYITDAGSSCGADFNGLGPNAGITIVEGHELAETITDQFPAGGWLDSGGAENGDKCAWITSGQGAAIDISFSGISYAVQSLWSNAFNAGSGGCVQSY